MSYTTIFKVPKEGEVESYAEFKNSSRGGLNVWKEMATSYLRKDVYSLMLNGMDAVWGLADSDEVFYNDRIVLWSTFDDIMVKRENLLAVAEAMDDFCIRYEPGSLPEQAQTLRELSKDKDCFAVCWRQTSVTCAWAEESDGELDEYGDEIGRNYDISKDVKHYFLSTKIAL